MHLGHNLLLQDIYITQFIFHRHYHLDRVLQLEPVPVLSVLGHAHLNVATPTPVLPLYHQVVEARPQHPAQVTADNRDPEPVVAGRPDLKYVRDK